MRRLLYCLTLLIGTYAGLSVAKADCASVSIAEMDWSSAAVIANVDKIILEAGYGCKVEMIPGDTQPTLEAMHATGRPDIAPEFWVNAVRPQLDKAIAEGQVVLGAETLSDGAFEGWWIPKFVADAHPEIKTVQQALARPELFPAPNDKSKGAVHNCPPGWSCQISTANLFRAFGAGNKNFELIPTSTSAELNASIARAFETKTGWLGYHWAPTAMLGKYDMVKLSFGVSYDRAEWTSCTIIPACENPRINNYPPSQAFALMSRGFAEKAGDAASYLKTRKWTNSTVNAVLAWQDDNKASNLDSAKYFLKTMPEIWTKWVEPRVADKIRAAL